ncbi:metallophosphoesterase family protein [Azospirillum sp. ST 5-10]|uniref:metallophosphoesterase family protein n=1 Tax=unclassified Azospirillum TaxID=2630922 RepID=UPI003F4A7FB6
MTVFFTADTHFGHAGAISRFRRPFAGVAEMDEAMVANWNATVAAGDEVWHLGDFALRRTPEAMAALLDRLHGTKHLITGNNDGPATRALPGWASVEAYAELVLDGTRLVLCHYAFRTWNGMYKGALNLHGHSHGQLKGMTRQVDVGVDVWSFRPVTLAELTAPRRRRAAGP